MDVGKIHGEAGIPAPRARRLHAGEIARILHRRAEAGRADHRAIGAGEAALGDIGPARMLEIAQAAAHAGRRRASRGPCFCAVRATTASAARPRRPSRRGAEASARTSRPVSDPTSTRKRCSSPSQLRQRQVEARLRLRAGLHGDAEAGAARLAAIHRDDEVPLAPRLVVRVDIGVADQHAVLNLDRCDLAGAHADEGEARVVIRRRLDAGRLRRCAVALHSF